MTVSLDEIMGEFTPKARRKVARKAAKIEARSVTLAELRDSLGMTQAQVADALETSQANVAKTERRPDVMLSTARRVVEALGGRLAVYAVLPGREPVALALPGASVKRAIAHDVPVDAGPRVYEPRTSTRTRKAPCVPGREGF